MVLTRKFNTATVIRIPVVKAGSVDHALAADWTPENGDVLIQKDGGGWNNVTNLPTAVAAGNSATWNFSLTATELSAAIVEIMISDAAIKVVVDSYFQIETFGNASANIMFDLGGAGAGAELLVVTLLTNLSAPVEGAVVYAHNASGALVGRANTNASGVAIVNPGPGIITLTASYAGYSIPSVSATVAPAVNQTASMVATEASVPASDDPTICTVSMTVRDLDSGVIKVGAQGTCTLAKLPQNVQGSFLVQQVITKESNAQGVIAWPLPRGAVVIIVIPGCYDKKVVVPDAAGLDLGA